MIKKVNQIPFWITIFLFLLIFYVSGITFPPSAETGSPGISAILYHMSVFFFLAIFLFFSFKEKKENKVLLVFLLLIAISYALLDEFHQAFIPGRFLSAGDFLVDCIGITFAFLVYIVITKIKEKSIK